MMLERKGRPLFFIDIAVPRNIEPSVADIKDVFLYNVDSLKKIAEENKRCREIEMEKAEKIVEDDVDDFISW
jgi:glutamyl-tRNA reductase